MMIFKRILSYACVMAVMVSAGTVSAFVSEVSDDYASVNDDKISRLLMDNGRSYKAYIEKHTGMPDVYEKTEVPAAGFDTKTNTGAEVVSQFEGKENVLNWSDNKGSVEWEFTAPEEGMYRFEFEYFPLKGTGKPIELCMELNGEVPVKSMASFYLNRVYADDTESNHFDGNGNEFPPPQVELSGWIRCFLTSEDGLIDGGLKLYLQQGTNRIRLYALSDPLVLSKIIIGCEKEPISYTQYISQYDEGLKKGVSFVNVEAEKAQAKSSASLVPSTDFTSSLTRPESISKVRLNMIGDNWNKSGQWLEWSFDVTEEGLYKVFFRYRQNGLKGFYTNRRLYIDGSVPFRDAMTLRFGYDGAWSGYTLKTDDGEDAYIYLDKGPHTLKLEVIQGDLGKTVENLDYVLNSLNYMYRKIIMVTGITPDTYRDYNLESEIPDLMETFVSCQKQIDDECDNIRRINDSKSQEANILKLISVQLSNMIKKPETIPFRLKQFSSNLSGLASWILDLRIQPLELDYICFMQQDAVQPKYKEGFFARAFHELRLFTNSFAMDYSTLDTQNGGEEKKVTLWFGGGREQAQILRLMLNSSFTPQSGIGVDLKLVQGSVLEAVMSNSPPDVAIFLGRSQPVNLAARGAAYNLASFDDFKTVKSWFGSDAMVPYTYNGGVYGIPDSETFFMTFYRKDIFMELGLEPPQTWDEFYNAASYINRHKMTVGLPYQNVDAWDAVNTGMGSRNIFPALLLQAGGQFYSEDLSGTALDSDVAREAFEKWTDMYGKYGFELAYDLYSRFRTGQMPLAISYYTSFYQFEAAAPEIRGLWDMVPIPGTPSEDGTVDRSQAAASSAAVILSGTKDADSAWEFIKWWTGAKAQAQYSDMMESRIGTFGRHSPANLEALSMIPWKRSCYESLKLQISQIVEIPELVGSYYTIRGVDNAFREVVLQDKNPVDALGKWNRQINHEITKKREEFGLAVK